MPAASAMITNFYDLIGRHNMAGTYARLGCGEAVPIEDPYDAPGEYYLVRELDTLPGLSCAPTNCSRASKGCSRRRPQRSI